MPQKSNSRRLITPLLLFTLAGWALWALGRNAPTPGETPETGSSGSAPEPAATRGPGRARARWSTRRLATSLAFATLFFGGAAFSAGAGDVVVQALEGTTTTETTSVEAAPANEATSDGTTLDENAEATSEESDTESDPPAESEETGENEPSDDGTAGEEDGSSEESGGTNETTPSDDSGDDGSGSADQDADGPGSGANSGPAGESETGAESGNPVLTKATKSSYALDSEVEDLGSVATVWLHRTLPDPTPPASRLDRAFAEALLREAHASHVSWAVLLAALRAQGFHGGSMRVTTVRTAAHRLVGSGVNRNLWRGLLAYSGRTAFADRAVALTRYNRAVGLRALVIGLEAAAPALRHKVLADQRLDIYAGGRQDVASGRTDVRVLALMLYMAEAHGQVTVTSLTTGHGLYARPGVVSAHIYGLAVDIAGLEGRPIYGNQEAGGLTERAVRNILLLPAELQPKQVISLLGLGGPSFPMANHDDHIHVGY
jgi:hypothetical protein